MFDSAEPRGGRVIILGIDPGLANTGWGVIESSGGSLRCVAYGCVRTSSDDQLSTRLCEVHDGVASVISAHSPTACAIENVYFSTNVRTAFATGQARGAALVAAASASLAVGEYGPGEVKLAVTGTGSADKRQVAYMVRVVLGLAEEPAPDHAADALALAICHANLAGTSSVAHPAGGGSGATAGWLAAVARAERREAGGRR